MVNPPAAPSHAHLLTRVLFVHPTFHAPSTLHVDYILMSSAPMFTFGQKFLGAQFQTNQFRDYTDRRHMTDQTSVFLSFFFFLSKNTGLTFLFSFFFIRGCPMGHMALIRIVSKLISLENLPIKFLSFTFVVYFNFNFFINYIFIILNHLIILIFYSF